MTTQTLEKNRTFKLEKIVAEEEVFRIDPKGDIYFSARGVPEEEQMNFGKLLYLASLNDTNFDDDDLNELEYKLNSETEKTLQSLSEERRIYKEGNHFDARFSEVQIGKKAIFIYKDKENEYIYVSFSDPVEEIGFRYK